MNVRLATADRPDCTHLYGGVMRLSIDRVTSAIVLDYRPPMEPVVLPLHDYLIVQVEGQPGDWWS